MNVQYQWTCPPEAPRCYLKTNFKYWPSVTLFLALLLFYEKINNFLDRKTDLRLIENIEFFKKISLTYILNFLDSFISYHFTIAHPYYLAALLGRRRFWKKREVYRSIRGTLTQVHLTERTLPKKTARFELIRD